MKTLEAGKQFCLNPGVIGRRFVGLVFAQLRLSKCFFYFAKWMGLTKVF